MTTAKTSNKIYVSEQEHMLDGFRLGRQIYDSGFRPTFIVGLWRGGSAVGIVVQECLATLGVDTDHISLRTSYRGREDYEQRIAGKDNIRVHGRQYLLENLNQEDSLLIVDDVFSSGRHTQAVIDSLAKASKRNMPADVRVAAPWWRRSKEGELFTASESKPDFYLHETSDWLVLPYEMLGLSIDEIAEHKTFLMPMLERAGVTKP
ncbi:MAG: hypoxanthine phosphoribosyltransferase [Pseudomonadaceae bacterium]|nr:hypoxanthine phosphoribosyltransferase [Pseudomonadaceae bacterium]